MQKLFEQIYSDPKVIDAYAAIKVKESALSDAWATHDLDHINRVISTCERIAHLLKLDDKEIAKIKIAALLHDIGCALGYLLGLED